MAAAGRPIATLLFLLGSGFTLIRLREHGAARSAYIARGNRGCSLEVHS
jgi:hypothetical protein